MEDQKPLERDQRLPPMIDWLARVAELEPVVVSQSAAEVIREAREKRDEQRMARQSPAP